MSKRASKKRSSPPPAKAALLGLLLSLAIILLLSAVGGLFVSKGTIPEKATGTIAALGVFLAAAFGPLPLLRATGKRTLPNVYLHMGLLLAMLAICKLIFWPGAPYGSWAALFAAPVGATLCGLIQARRGKVRR